MQSSRSQLPASRASPPLESETLAHRFSPRKKAATVNASIRDNQVRLALPGRTGLRRLGSLCWLRQFARRKWRLVALILIAVATTATAVFRSLRPPPLVIPRRPYVRYAYKHLDDALPIDMATGARVLHVTKEFGPATMGGLGVMLTALCVAESDSPLLSVSVALPYYSYLRELYPPGAIVHFADLSVPFKRKPSTGRVRNVRFSVYLLRWQYRPDIDFLDPDSASHGGGPSRSIDVYLIGPGEQQPFATAFQAKHAGDIYSAYKPLKQEWKDLYFARAVHALVQHLGISRRGFELDSDAEHLRLDRVESTGPNASIDVVHLHGATNAMVAHFLRKGLTSGDEQCPPFSVECRCAPAVVYTLHDSLDEVEYSNLVSNAAHFVGAAGEPTPSSLDSLCPYIYRAGTQLFTSALGIDLADMVTFVSRSIAASIVSGAFRFHLEGLVMPSILARAARGQFVGVTNGLDFTERSRNPFTNEKLVAHELAFPRVGRDLLDPSSFDKSFSASKDRARKFVLQQLPHIFSPEDTRRPWFLFIGRYQYNKGCQLFSTLLEILSSPAVDGRLILLGARNNYPFEQLTTLAKRFPRHLVFIDDASPATSRVQAEWGTHLRLASDIAFVPSLSEAFGLVAAEALLFGMPVLSTGVGGLREFLVPAPEPGANSYLFDLFPQRHDGLAAVQGAEQDYSQAAHDVRPDEEQLAPAREELRRATEHALRDWRALRNGSYYERERSIRELVTDALALTWDRQGGPVEEYMRVYSEALRLRRRRFRSSVVSP